MRKWGVNTLVFIQHSFIFLAETKASSTTENNRSVNGFSLSTYIYTYYIIAVQRRGFWGTKTRFVVYLSTCKLLWNVNLTIYNSLIIRLYILKFCFGLVLISFTTERTELLNFRLCIHMTKLKELIMGRHWDVCNVSSQHEVPSK